MVAAVRKMERILLAGKRAAPVCVQCTRPTGHRLAKTEAQPAQALYTTLDRDFQVAAQQAISNFRGAIVVLERDTGRVLTMVSSPGFDRALLAVALTNPSAF
jgi:cell division protein FtsI/penicillin-binding protein 2